MAETNGDFGRAVQEALSWLGATPETGGALLGINARTLDAMSHGIVPMRSLIIRFAGELQRHCERQPGAPDWWKDADAWLNLAGYPPRRDGAPVPNGRPAAPAANGAAGAPRHPVASFAPPSPRPAPAAAAPRQESPQGARPAAVATAPPADDPPAKDCYRPVYERKVFNDDVVHIFRIVDREEQRVFEMTLAASEDYKARAAQVKQDLGALTRSQFERKYGRFRLNGR